MAFVARLHYGVSSKILLVLFFPSVSRASNSWNASLRGVRWGLLRLRLSRTMAQDAKQLAKEMNLDESEMSPALHRSVVRSS